MNVIIYPFTYRPILSSNTVPAENCGVYVFQAISMRT